MMNMNETLTAAPASALEAKPASASYTIKASIVLPPDTNHHGTIFGGKLMAYIDDVATIAATRHARRPVVTASTDSVDFLQPVRKGDAVCLSAFVTWTHKTSMEVFVRVVTEQLLTGERKVCATSFLTFVALGDDGRPTEVPGIIPGTVEEQKLFETAPIRKEARKIRRQESKHFAEFLGADYRLHRWEPVSRPLEGADSTDHGEDPTRVNAVGMPADRRIGFTADAEKHDRNKADMTMDATSDRSGIADLKGRTVYGHASSQAFGHEPGNDSSNMDAFARMWNADWE